MVRIAILSDFDRAIGRSANPEKVEMFRQRHRWWREAAAVCGWELDVLDASEILAGPSLLRNHGLVFVDMPVLRPDVYRELVAACEMILPADRILDPTGDVDRLLSLAGDYARLQDFPAIATLRTARVPIPDDVADEIDSAEDVERLIGANLEPALAEAGLNLAAGVFLRGFYASMRSQNPAYFFANARPQLTATACRVIRGLRRGFALGGLAIREYLTLEEVAVPADKLSSGGSVPLEIRLTFVSGKCISASFHGPYEDLTERQKSAVGERLRADGLPERLFAVARDLIAFGLPPNAVADVVFRKDNPTPVVSEFNPLYSSGYRVPTARAWSFANLSATVASAAGYRPLDAASKRRLTASLLGEEWDDRGVIHFQDEP